MSNARIVTGRVALLATLFALISVSSAMATPVGDYGGDAPVVPGEVVVKFKRSSAPAERAHSLAVAGATSSSPIGTPATRVVDVGGPNGVRDSIRRLRRMDEVVWVEPNYIYSAAVVPDDPFFDSGELWGLRNTGQTVEQFIDGGAVERQGKPGMDVGNIESAWDVTTGSDDVLIGVIDSGILEHPDLVGNLRTDLSRDFRGEPEEQADPFADAAGHGTHVSGTIGAVGDNGLGVAGVNWHAGLVALRALDPLSGTNADLAAAFAYAGQLGLPVVNASIGGSAASLAIRDAIRLSPNTLFVAAAGNESVDVDGGVQTSYPCAYDLDNIICIAAMGNTGDMSDFSNFGTESVDFGAPGNQIMSTYPTYKDHLDLPVNSATFNEDWETGPDQKWEVQTIDLDGDVLPVLASNPAPDDGGVRDGLQNYIQNEEPMDLSGQRGCTFQGFYDADFGQPSEMLATVERSVDGITWKSIGVIALSSPPEVWPEFDYSLHADGMDTVLIRVRAFADDPASGDLHGLRILDPHVQCIDQNASADYELDSGTSMAAPHVTGAAALLLSRNPELSTAELRDALIDTVRTTPSMEGKTVTGGRLDLEAALAAVEPEAPPQVEMDIRPGVQNLRRQRGVVFRATTDVEAGILARAAVRWRGHRIWVIGSRIIRSGPEGAPLRRLANRLAKRYRQRGIVSPAKRARQRVIRLAREGRQVRVPAGRVIINDLSGARRAPWNERAVITDPGRITTLRLRPRPAQFRRLVRLQRLGIPLLARLAARANAPDNEPSEIVRRKFRLR